MGDTSASQNIDTITRIQKIASICDLQSSPNIRFPEAAGFALAMVAPALTDNAAVGSSMITSFGEKSNRAGNSHKLTLPHRLEP